jgi:hypothetical protein
VKREDVMREDVMREGVKREDLMVEGLAAGRVQPEQHIPAPGADRAQEASGTWSVASWVRTRRLTIAAVGRTIDESHRVAKDGAYGDRAHNIRTSP